jgi:hypothetical protein
MERNERGMIEEEGTSMTIYLGNARGIGGTPRPRPKVIVIASWFSDRDAREPIARDWWHVCILRSQS